MGVVEERRLQRASRAVMQMNIRTTIILLAGLCTAAGGALAQANYPTKPMRWVIPYTPGGGADLIARPIAQRLGEVLGQAVV